MIRQEKKPLVSLSLIVLKDKSVLIGKRKESPGKGSFGFPGGILSYGEDLDYSAFKKIKEEVRGLRINLIDRFAVAATNDYFEKEGEHYVTLYLRGLYKSGSPEFLHLEESDFETWKWVTWEELKHGDVYPIFLPVKNLLMQGFNPFEKISDSDDKANIDFGKSNKGRDIFSDLSRASMEYISHLQFDK